MQLKQAFARWRNRPLARLVAHFAAVIAHTGQDANESNLNLSIGGLLAILAVPGGFMSLLLFDKYSSLMHWLRGVRNFDPYSASLPDKYFFIVFSMAVTGIVAVLKWDRIFPSRQDYANLAPLPIPLRAIYLANLAALVLLAALFAVDVNATSALLFPLVVLSGGGGGNYLSFVAVHSCVVVLASAFTFFACFALIGALMSCLPSSVFRRVSLYARLLIVVALMTMLLTNFAVPPRIVRLAAHPGSLVRWLPPVWFVALYQSMQGKANRELQELASVALKASAAALALAMGFGASSYRRYFLRIPESGGGEQTARRKPLRLAAGLWDRVLLRDPFERACYHFALRALARSEMHCILLGAFLGLGLILGSQSAATAFGRDNPPPLPPPDLLAASLCLSYFVISGLRFVFEVPAAQGANWIFKLNVDEAIGRASSPARKLILTFLVPVAIVPSLVYFGRAWGWPTGLLHAGFVLVMSVLFMEALLVRFRKIPFTCALPDFENHLILFIAAYVTGFFFYTSIAAALERWMLARPIRFLGAIPFLALAWYGIQRLKLEQGDPGAGLTYERPLNAAVQVLNILDR